MPNLGQKTLNLAPSQAEFSFVFLIAPVHRPLVSVGKICDNGNDVLFTADKATVRDPHGEEVCVFDRQPGGFYIAKLKILSPFARPEK